LTTTKLSGGHDAAAAGYLDSSRVIFNEVLISAFPATIDERTSFVVLPGCIFRDDLLLHFRRLFLHVIFKHGVLGGRCYWDPWLYFPFYLALSNRLVVIVRVCFQASPLQMSLCAFCGTPFLHLYPRSREAKVGRWRVGVLSQVRSCFCFRKYMAALLGLPAN